MAKSGLLPFGAILLLPVLLYAGCNHLVGRYEDNANAAHIKARRSFFADLPQTDCLRADDILSQAQARGWETRDNDTQHSCIRPDNVQSWLRVIVDPPLPFSTEDENSHMFGFDDKGCSIGWEYASGPGSTCPAY